MEFKRRTELVVDLNSVRSARNLRKYGSLKYFSHSMHYAILYVNSDSQNRVEKELRRKSFVRKVTASPLAALAKHLVVKTVAADDRDEN